jgi:3-phenylpropionate/trans-cinnamate dioxygenase ferredoxin component
MAEFKTVAATDEINPGEVLLVECGQMWVLLFNVGGAYYAIEDRCSHADVNLSEGEIDLSACTIKCPKHGSQFDIKTGATLNPPAVTSVVTFDVQVVGSEIQIARRQKRKA